MKSTHGKDGYRESNVNSYLQATTPTICVDALLKWISSFPSLDVDGWKPLFYLEGTSLLPLCYLFSLFCFSSCPLLYYLQKPFTASLDPSMVKSDTSFMTANCHLFYASR